MPDSNSSCNRHFQEVVLFDAVGTLLYPEPEVAVAYQALGSRHGSLLTVKEISHKFPTAYREYFAGENHGYHRPTDEDLERQKWKRLVASIFGTDFSERLFADLWDHFALPENWECYPEAEKIIDQLIAGGVQVGIASNFDGRLFPLIHAKFPSIPRDNIFWSTHLGYSKPDVRFYCEVTRKLSRSFGKIRPLMIGDHWQFDVEAPQRAGWNAIWKSSERLPTVPEIAGRFSQQRF